MLRFRWNFANVFSTSFPRVLFLGFWIFEIFFEKLQFFCRSGLRKFFRHPYYMVPPTLNTFPMLRFRWNFAHVFSTSFPRLLFSDFGFSKYISKTSKRGNKEIQWFIYTKIFKMCVHFKKRCRFVFYSARAFIWGITWPSTTSISFLYLYGSCLARIIGKTRPRLFWDPRPRWNTGPGRTMLRGSVATQSTKGCTIGKGGRAEKNGGAGQERFEIVGSVWSDIPTGPP